MDERIYQIALSLLNGLGPVKARILLNEIGSLEGIFQEKESLLIQTEGIRQDILQSLNREAALIRAEQELEFISDKGIQLYYWDDQNYPWRLKECPDAPIVLFSLGKIDLNQRSISIVGTRKSTSYGKKLTDDLVADLSDSGIQIISGLAHGIDKAAHEAAINNNMATIAVLGHGLDSLYPAAHRQLAKRMLENGGLVTEFISGTPGDPSNFPKRNRIVAGLSEATVVVESSESGGSMITANLAFDYNREVFAFPGNIDRNSSSGCNNLIKRSRAQLITSGEDITTILDLKLKEKPAIDHAVLFDDLTEHELQLIQLFKEKGELNIDDILVKTEIGVAEISVILFNLEMKGIVKSLPGKQYDLA